MGDKIILNEQDLLKLNEMMLGRGMPNQEDGIGYNKGDFGACSNYFYGCSDSQIYDLAKRLVKYSKTQLHIDKKIMEDTADYFLQKCSNPHDREIGVSVNISENESHIGFKYNESFIDIIKSQPMKKFDKDMKQWIVPNKYLLKTLYELKSIGADADNAINYAEINLKNIKEESFDRVVVKIIEDKDNDLILLKFDFNKDILNIVKRIDKSFREWNPKFKYWTMKTKSFDSIRSELSQLADFDYPLMKKQ